MEEFTICFHVTTYSNDLWKHCCCRKFGLVLRLSFCFFFFFGQLKHLLDNQIREVHCLKNNLNIFDENQAWFNDILPFAFMRVRGHVQSLCVWYAEWFYQAGSLWSITLAVQECITLSTRSLPVVTEDSSSHFESVKDVTRVSHKPQKRHRDWH